MTDAANHRNPAIENSSCHYFLVERPQILERSAAAGHDDCVDSTELSSLRIQAANGCGNFIGSTFSLYANRMQQDGYAAVSPFQGLQNIADGCSGRTGHYRYTLRKPR